MTLAELDPYVDALVARLRSLLRAELLGVYVGGSVALGAYAPGRSDVDVAVVSRGALSARRKRSMVDALRHESLPCPARGLELVAYPEAVVRVPSGEAGFELNLNTGSRLPFHVDFDPTGVPPHWFVVDRAILAEHALAVLGPPARALFARIPRAIILPALVEAVRWDAARDRTGGGDAVLNACRGIRFATESVWSSKPEAGRWALGRAADRELVERALAARATGEPLDRARVRAFLERAARSVAAAS